MISVGFIALAFIAMVMILAAGVYLSRQRHEKPDQECTAKKAWSHYMSKARYLDDPGPWTTRDLKAIESLRQKSDGTKEKLKASIGETVDKALAAQKPVAILREAIMDATDRFVPYETLSRTEGSAGESMDEFESVLEAGALRCFSMLRFGDYDKEDWYSYYVKVAQVNCSNVAAMVGKTVRGEQTMLETSLHDRLTRIMAQTRTTLLHDPQRTRVKEAEMIAGTAPAELAPSEGQIERLTEIMTERLAKLLAGNIYYLEHGPIVNPVGAFQVDAALLHTHLSLRFRQPDKGWRQIVGKLLGEHGDMEQNAENILKIAGGFRQVWEESRQDDPLAAVLNSAFSIAFPGAGPADGEAVTSRMMQDASVLVGAIREVLEELK